MRKIFLFISAVMMSVLSLQATVITKNFDLSGTSAYGTATVSGGTITGAAGWAGAQLWQWTEGALAYDQAVLEVANHANPVLFRIQYSDETNVDKQLPAGINTMAIDLTQDIVKGVFVLNWSDVADVNITINGLYLRGAIGEKKDLVTLWEGSEHFTAYKDWDSEVILAADAFADAHLGDILEINYTLDEVYNQIQLYTSYNQYRPEFLRPLNEWNQYNINKTNELNQLHLAIVNSTDLEKLQTDGGLRINGINFTLTSVKLIRHNVLWSGSQVVGDWSGGQSVAWSKLTDLKVGNILCVRVTAGEYVEAAYNQVFCSYKSDWTGVFSPSVNYLFQEGDEMPMIVEIPVTNKMLKQLKGEQLNIGGKNYTMTDIFIKEGTPTTTVAEYLNVSAAGMATYILPFDVPTLPAGVEAYNLTNNGDETIWADQVDALEADKPVLIVAAAGEYEFVSEAGASDDISAKTSTYTNGALIGTYQSIDPLAETTDANYNYVLNNGTDGVAFYQVLDATCSVPAYRAYLSCGHNANAGGPGMAPKKSMRIVFHQDIVTGIEDVQGCKVQSTKVLRDGQLFILRNGVEYNVNGQLAK